MGPARWRSRAGAPHPGPTAGGPSPTPSGSHPSTATPLRNYTAPVDGSTTQAVRQLSAIFQRELFGEFSAKRLAAAGPVALSPALRAHLEQLSADPGALPPPATALLVSAWGHMHGLVVLEVFGHTSFIGEHQADIFHMAMRNLLEDVHRRIPDGAGQG